MRKTKEDSGITLIALIITIIVLLILAGITISLVVGDNGVLNQAKNASIETSKADLEEALGRAVSSAEGEYATSPEFNGGSETFYEWLKGNHDKLEKAESDGYTITLKNKTDEIQGTITKKDKNNGLKFKLKGGETTLDVDVDITGEYNKGPQKVLLASQLTPKEDYGQFVDYGLDLSGDGKTTNDWKIFYTDKERIFLIAADYVPNNCSVLKTAMDEDHSNMLRGTNNYKVSQRDICCLGWRRNDAPNYKCGDEDCQIPSEFLPDGDFCGNHYYYSEHHTTNGQLCAASLQCPKNWESFLTESSKRDYAANAIGGPTLELWVASYNETHEDRRSYVDTKGENGYRMGKIGDKIDSMRGNFQNLDTNDKLYFPHNSDTFEDLFEDNSSWSSSGELTIGVKDSGYSMGYWIAGTEYLSDYTVLFVEINGNVFFDNYYIREEQGVRPVISLKSEVEIMWVDESDSNCNDGYYKIVED